MSQTFHQADAAALRVHPTGDAAAIGDYLTAPPSREALAEILRIMGARPRDMLRRRGTPYAELGLDDPALSDEEILEAMIANPILIDRPAALPA